MIVALLLSLDRLLAVAGARRATGLVYALSSIIAGLGCYWFLMRTIIA
jgi:hypothetical protein